MAAAWDSAVVVRPPLRRRLDLRGVRAVHVFTAVVGVAALITQLTLTIRGVDVLVPESGVIAPTPVRIVRFFSYFTIQSNVLVIVTAIGLALKPDRDGRLWRVVRLDALVGITVTGIVYAIVLAPTLDLHGITGMTDKIFHYGMPFLAILGWAAFGPRPRIDWRTLAWSALWPVLYIGYVLLFGGTTGWYPYPFTNVSVLGFNQVLINGALIVALLLAMGALYRWLDSTLPARP